jgi:hypothetical protein
VEWLDVTYDRDQWQAPVNTVLNLRVALEVGNFLTS